MDPMAVFFLSSESAERTLLAFRRMLSRDSAGGAVCTDAAEVAGSAEGSKGSEGSEGTGDGDRPRLDDCRM